MHGTGFLLLAEEGKLVACDPETGGAVVWTADLDAAVAEGPEEEEGLATGAAGDGGGAVRMGRDMLYARPRDGMWSSHVLHPKPLPTHHRQGWLAALHLAEQEGVLCVHRRTGALVLVDAATGEASLAGVVGPGGVLAASLAPDEELLVFVTGAGVLLGMTPGLEVLYEVS